MYTLQHHTVHCVLSPVPGLGDEWVPCWAQTSRSLSQKSRSSASPPQSSHSNVQAMLHTINVGLSVDVQYMHTDDHACCSSLSLGSARVKQEIFPADITHCTFVLPHQSTEISPSRLLAAMKRTLMTVFFFSGHIRA